jgi:hypothetical protein
LNLGAKLQFGAAVLRSFASPHMIDNPLFLTKQSFEDTCPKPELGSKALSTALLQDEMLPTQQRLIL